MLRETPRLSIAAVALILGASCLFAGDSPQSEPTVLAAAKARSAAADRDPQDERKRAIHALNRLSFGPRPGDLERVLSTGVNKWIEQQLNPGNVDDSALDARLSGLLTWKMTSREIVESFPPRPLVRGVAEGRRAIPPQDADGQLIYETAVRRYRESIQEKLQADGNADPQATPLAQEDRQQQAAARQETRRWLAALTAMKPEDRLRAFAAMNLPELRALNRLPLRGRAILVADLTPHQREIMLALIQPELVVTTELRQGKLLRAIYSERQLQEVMTDFWMNHFNVFIGKGVGRYLLTSYERDVIRPRALGKFQDLLIATAQSPAMLFYLDNWQSVGPRSAAAEVRFPPRPDQQANPAKRGLNENYARELMELHTLGVDGGYTQQDVTEVARALTGWSIEPPGALGQRARNWMSGSPQVQFGEFVFRPRAHEPGSKVILGKTFKEDGEREGLLVLEMLAQHPSTARFVSRKLATRFVSDEPPPALVERMAKTFTKTDGDIREVLRTMFRSPEFWSPEAYRAKIKTPFELVVSALRATDGEVQNAQPLVQALNRMGMPLYGSQPPTGYLMNEETWVNSAALLERMNFALAFGVGRIPGAKPAIDRLLRTPPAMASSPASVTTVDTVDSAAAAQARLEQLLLMGDVSQQTHAAVASRLTDPQVIGQSSDDSGSLESLIAVLTEPARPSQFGTLIGLILGSPEFQRR